MKLSNKILIAFFGLIFVYLTAAFTELRVRGVSHRLDDENSIAESVDITGVKQLTLENLGKHVYMYASDTARLEVRSNEGQLMQKLKYRQIGEELILEKLDISEDQAIRISIFLPPQSLHTITTHGASLTIYGLEQRDLKISQEDGWIRFSNDSRIGKLTLQTSDAYFNVSESDLDTLIIESRNSEITVDSPVRILEGNLQDTTFLRMYKVDDIRLKRDEMSRALFNSPGNY